MAELIQNHVGVMNGSTGVLRAYLNRTAETHRVNVLGQMFRSIIRAFDKYDVMAKGVTNEKCRANVSCKLNYFSDF